MCVTESDGWREPVENDRKIASRFGQDRTIGAKTEPDFGYGLNVQAENLGGFAAAKW